MDRITIKNIVVHSLILGLILGIISAIPYVGIYALFAVIILSAPIVLLYLIMDSKYDFTTVKDSIISGAISGFSANVSFCFGYAVVALLINLAFNYSTNLILNSMIIKSPLWLLIVFVVFISVFVATTNAFSGFLTYYFVNMLRDIYERKNRE